MDTTIAQPQPLLTWRLNGVVSYVAPLLFFSLMPLGLSFLALPESESADTAALFH